MKASDILLEASEDIHMTGTFDDAVWDYNEGVVVKAASKYCALGLLRCKGGYYTTGKGYWEALGIVGLPEEATESIVTNPVTGKREMLRLVVVYLNDAQGWTFKQIGEWLRSLGY